MRAKNSSKIASGKAFNQESFDLLREALMEIEQSTIPYTHIKSSIYIDMQNRTWSWQGIKKLCALSGIDSFGKSFDEIYSNVMSL